MEMILPIGPCPCRIMIVGECPSAEDMRQKVPFSDYTGKELDRMLAAAGIQRSACFMTYVLHEVPLKGRIESMIAETKKEITEIHQLYGPPGKEKFILPKLKDGIELLKREIELCQPNVIIAAGNVALWALTGEWSITNWRGSVVPVTLPLSLNYTVKVIPIIPPWMVMKQWSWRQITIHDLKRVKTESGYRNIIRPNYNFIIRPNFGQVYAILEILQKEVRKGKLRLAVDVETRVGHMDCIGIAWSHSEALCIPLMHTALGSHYWSENEELILTYQMYKLMTNPNCHIVGQNFAYDAQYTYRHWHFVPNLVQDTSISQHVCFSNMRKNLGFLSSMYAQNHVYWKEEGKEWSSAAVEDERWEYNCKDCVRTLEVADELLRVVDKMGLTEVHKFQQKLFWPVLETMNRGIKPDLKKKGEFSSLLIDEMAKREQYFIDVIGYPLNPRSNPQMQGLFYDELGQKPIINRKTKNPSCDDESLRKIAIREPLLKPLCNAISEYRSLGIFLSTYVNSRLDIDGRIRCMFKITGAETYRFASTKNAFGSGMNLQNVSSGGGGEDEDDLELPNIRTMFIPDEGMEFFDIDLDSADLRVMCSEANVKEMKAMMKEGKKVYVEVMKEYYNDPTLTKYSPQYGTFKSFCHGTNYLGTANGLADRLGLTRHMISKLQKWYFGKFPEIEKWHKSIKNSVTQHKMVKNIFGYRMYFFDRIEGTILNQAAAWIPQSTVACIINRGYMNIHEKLKDIQVLLQVHDSLAGQYPVIGREQYIKAIIEACSIPLPYDEPMTVPVGIKTSQISWGDCK